MVPYLIPLQPFNQTFSVSLGGLVYILRVVWNNPNGTWSMDISDQSGNPLLQGVPLATGADLLGQFRYLGIGGAGGQMVAQSSFDADVPPTYADLGNQGNLFFVAP